jgi:galactokinase
MPDLNKTRANIASGGMDERFARLYDDAAAARARYLHLTDLYAEQFGDGTDIRFFSAPGRTEVCGNHTDHNHGCVIAAAINLDAVACAEKTADGIIRIKSENYPGDTVDLSVLTPQEKEREKSVSLVRGVAARFQQLGYQIGGLNAVTVNNVLKGSGMSSSAAFEVLVGTLLNFLYNDGKISPVEIAKIAQYAENEFFGKPCGLMDQVACAVGGIVAIDFADPKQPVIEQIDFDLTAAGYNLCIVNTGGNHADLTDDYASIPAEMKLCAEALGAELLRYADGSALSDPPRRAELEKALPPRAILRAEHFFAENARVPRMAEALCRGDMAEYIYLMNASGLSSREKLQNVVPSLSPSHNEMALALDRAGELLSGKGAWRIHGGGFAGCIQCLVPLADYDAFRAEMDVFYGEGACFELRVRPCGPHIFGTIV